MTSQTSGDSGHQTQADSFENMYGICRRFEGANSSRLLC